MTHFDWTILKTGNAVGIAEGAVGMLALAYFGPKVFSKAVDLFGKLWSWIKSKV